MEKTEAVFQIEDGILTRFSGTGEVTVPEGVRGMRVSVFMRKQITRIVLPESLEKISAYAFRGCKALKEIVVMNPQTEFQDRCFADCDADVVFGDGRVFRELKDGCMIQEGVMVSYRGTGDTLRIPEGVESLAQYAFWPKTDLKKIVIPKGVQRIGQMQFCGSSQLREVILENGTVELEEDAFYGCPADVWFSDGRQYRQYRYIDDCEIVNGCLTKCDQEADVITLPEGIREIRKGAFADWMDVDVRLPRSLEVLRGDEFSLQAQRGWLRFPEEGQMRIRMLPLVGSLWRFEMPREPHGFVMDGDKLLGYIGIGGEVVIPEGVRVIGKHAFARWQGIRRIRIPDTVREIEDGAFRMCEDLEEICFPESVAYMGENVCADCGKLRYGEIRGRLGTIPGYLFSRCVELRRVKLPEGVERIGECAFEGCVSLEQVDGFRQGTQVEAEAFLDCGMLNVSVDEEQPLVVETDGDGEEWDANQIFPGSYGAIQMATRVGCEDCLRIFAREEILDWGYYGTDGACPYCGRRELYGQIPGKVLDRRTLRRK